MVVDLSRRLTETVERELPNVRALVEEQASLPRAPGKWSAKEELGHLIDSAANNHIRFVGGALTGQFHGPGYAQDDWVRLHGYGAMHWQTLVDFWFSYNRFLAGLVDRIPEPQWQTECFIDRNAPSDAAVSGGRLHFAYAAPHRPTTPSPVRYSLSWSNEIRATRVLIANL